METICVDEVVENLLKKIKDSKDGEEYTTADLLANELGEAWIEKADFSDIMEIEEALFEKSKDSGIVLDKGQNKDLIVGLPYNIPFVVRKNACAKEIDESGYIPEEYLKEWK